MGVGSGGGVGVGSGGGVGVGSGGGVGVGAGFFVGVGLGRRVGVGAVVGFLVGVGLGPGAAPPGFGVGRGPGVAGTPVSGVGDGTGATRLGIASPSSGPLPGGASAAGDGTSSPDGKAAPSGGDVSPSTAPVRLAKMVGPIRSTTMIAIPTADASRISWTRGGSGSSRPAATGAGPPPDGRCPATTIRVGPTGAGLPSSRR